MKIKGNVLLARREFVRDHFGGDGWRRVLEALEPADRMTLEGIIVQMLWYPFDLGSRLDGAIVKVLGRGDTAIFEEIGAESARVNLGSVHQDFLVRGNPQAFMANMPAVYGFYYDTGRRTYERTGPDSCLITTLDADSFSVVDCLTVAGWFREGLKMCGAKSAEVVEETCRAKGADACRYRVRWTV